MRKRIMVKGLKIILLMMVTSCTTNIPSKDFDRQGHRGCRGLMPENTIPAMIKAIDMGVTTLEMDIVFSADKQAILSHEPFFSHDITTKPDGSFVGEQEEKSLNLYTMNYEEIKKYDVGMKPHPRFPDQVKMRVYKPLLEEVIDTVEKYTKQKNLPQVYYNIETKTASKTDNVYHPAPAEFVDLLMKVIDLKKIRDRVIIQSFDIRTLQFLHQEYPGVKTSLLIDPAEMISINGKIKELGFVPDAVSPEYHMVSASIVNEMHKENMKIIPWTVNNITSINALKSIGVDGIISDYPNLLQ